MAEIPADTLRKKLVDAFLQRHGFADLNDSRDMSGIYKAVRMEPACPIQVAAELGNEAMVKMLMEARAAGTGAFSNSRGRAYAFSEKTASAPVLGSETACAPKEVDDRCLWHNRGLVLD